MSSLPFYKYGSIENLSSKELHNAQAHFPKIGSMEFVVLEKAHGAHFSLQTDGKLVEAGKRNSTIPEKEEFFGHTVLIKKYSTGACAIFDRVCATFTKCVSIQIEGELIGGKYSHPNVQNFDIPRVQKGVEYCPGYELFVYDIKWFDGKKWTFIDYDICCELFKQNGFYYATPLARGIFNEVVNYNPCFQSLIPSLFGLPPLDKNYAEGVVIKPGYSNLFPKWVPSDSQKQK
jgi:Rnl2 family RNA ligase